MYNKFKINEKVIVNGIGKCNGKVYRYRKATIICRDPFFLDYNVRFADGSEDWIDKQFLKKIKRRISK